MKKYFLSVLLFLIVFIFNISLSNAQSVCVNLQNNLKVGSQDYYTNGEVSRLQNFLYSKGYLNISPTGYFGFMTKRAVVLYQQNKGFVAVGYVGSLTRNAIYNDSCGYVPTPTPIYPSYYCSLNGQTYYSQNDYAYYCKSASLPDYTISTSLYSTSLGRNLSKNINGYYDATGVNGSVVFSLDTANNAPCSTYFKAQSSNSFSSVSNSKTFSLNFDSNILGIDYYRVSCGDGVNYKNIDQYFYIQTDPQTSQSYYCSLNGQTYYSQNDYNNYCKSITQITCPTDKDFYDINYQNCSCPSNLVKVSLSGSVSPIYIQYRCSVPVATCPITSNYFYDKDYPSCSCPNGYTKTMSTMIGGLTQWICK